MRVVTACRACLDTKGVLVRINDTYRRIFESACGVMVSPTDGYPYYFCVECMVQIKKILAFRRKSRRADFVLKEIMIVRSEVTTTDIATVDRKVTNLVSSLDIWNPQNIYLYTCDKSNEEEDNQLVQQPVKYDKGTIRIQCSELVDDTEDTNDFDDGVEDTAIRESEFDSVDDIVQKLGVDDTVEVEAKEEIDLNDVFKGLKESDSDDETKNSDAIKKNEEKIKVYAGRPFETRTQRAQRIRQEKQRLKEAKEKQKQMLETISSSYRSKALVLLNFKIELLSTEEQIRVHEAKWRSEPFKSSLFKCTICIKVFATVQLLIEHCEEHNQLQGKFTCSVCKMRLDSEEDRDIHEVEKHRYKYSCNLCKNYTYDFKVAVQHKCTKKPPSTERNVDMDNVLDEHFYLMPQSQEDMRAAMASTVGSHLCSVCNMRFTSQNVYKLHFELHVKRGSSKHQCEICGVYYKGDNQLAKHMNNFHQYLHQCKICSFETSHRYRALEHLEDHKASDAGCPYCPKRSKTQSGLRFHIRKFHYKELYNKICPLCGASFQSNVFFYSHQLERHKYIYLPHPPQELNELTCVHCNIEFKSKRAYETHVLLFEHEEANDIPYACRPCKKVFDNEESRDKHVLRCPSNSAFPMPCSICGVEVTSGKDYHFHCKRAHPTCLVYRGGKLCEECGKIISRTKFSKHLCRVKDKAFECTICNLKFATSRSYALHMVYKHTEYPFHCGLCPDKFKRRINAKEHILKVHTPVMPYTCPVCQRQFSILKYLNEHASAFHGMDLKDNKEYKIKKIKSSLFIYPHMKLNVSGIDRNQLDKIVLQVRDYNEKVIETISDSDYDKYLIFDEKPDIKPDVTPIVKPEIKIRKRRSKSELPVKPKKKKVVETVVTESGESLEVIRVDGEKYVSINGVAYRIENQ